MSEQGMTPSPAETANTAAPDPWETVDRQRRAVLEALTPLDSQLVRHALHELTLAEDEQQSYGGLVTRSVLDLIRVLAMHGHSGGSVELTLELFNRLARFDVLSPLTGHPDEWTDVSMPTGPRLWQNRRKSTVFWREGEPTWYDLDDAKKAAAR